LTDNLATLNAQFETLRTELAVAKDKRLSDVNGLQNLLDKEKQAHGIHLL